jgi:hypothetical protein
MDNQGIYWKYLNDTDFNYGDLHIICKDRKLHADLHFMCHISKVISMIVDRDKLNTIKLENFHSSSIIMILQILYTNNNNLFESGEKIIEFYTLLDYLQLTDDFFVDYVNKTLNNLNAVYYNEIISSNIPFTDLIHLPPDSIKKYYISNLCERFKFVNIRKQDWNIILSDKRVCTCYFECAFNSGNLNTFDQLSDIQLENFVLNSIIDDRHIRYSPVRMQNIYFKHKDIIRQIYPHSSPRYHIFVGDISARIYSIACECTETILNVKKIIGGSTGIPVPQIRLIYAGRILVDDKTLNDYNIRKYSTVYIILAIRGD